MNSGESASQLKNAQPFSNCRVRSNRDDNIRVVNVVVIRRLGSRDTLEMTLSLRAKILKATNVCLLHILLYTFYNILYSKYI